MIGQQLGPFDLGEKGIACAALTKLAKCGEKRIIAVLYRKYGFRRFSRFVKNFKFLKVGVSRKAQ